MKYLKLVLILAFLYFITSSFGDWLIKDSKEIRELITHGYLPSDWTHDDIFKLCNPETAEEEAALEKAPKYTWTCLTRGGWS